MTTIASSVLQCDENANRAVDALKSRHTSVSLITAFNQTRCSSALNPIVLTIPRLRHVRDWPMFRLIWDVAYFPPQSSIAADECDEFAVVNTR